jgi:hypothetical protein
MNEAVLDAIAGDKPPDMPLTASASTTLCSADLKARLVAFAREVGFDLCRVAICAAPAHEKEFRDWLREGAHGEMDYMPRAE